MRVIKEFTLSPSIKCTLFSWNGKYIIKLEEGNLEQTYKVAEMDITGINHIENLLSSVDFKQRAELIFEQMNTNLDRVFD